MRIAAVLILAASQLTAVPFVSALAMNQARQADTARLAVTQFSPTENNLSVFYMTPSSPAVTAAVELRENNRTPL